MSSTLATRKHCERCGLPVGATSAEVCAAVERLNVENEQWVERVREVTNRLESRLRESDAEVERLRTALIQIWGLYPKGTEAAALADAALNGDEARCDPG